jgi:hypothetical protein
VARTLAANRTGCGCLVLRQPVHDEYAWTLLLRAVSGAKRRGSDNSRSRASTRPSRGGTHRRTKHRSLCSPKRKCRLYSELVRSCGTQTCYGGIRDKRSHSQKYRKWKSRETDSAASWFSRGRTTTRRAALRAQMTTLRAWPPFLSSPDY